MVTTVNTPNSSTMHRATALQPHYIDSMATTGDSIDPRGTKRPNKNLIHESSRIYRPLKVIKCLSKPCLPPHIRPNNAYSIFSLFFNDEVLGVIIKNTNRYGFRYYQALKATWHDLSARCYGGQGCPAQ